MNAYSTLSSSCNLYFFIWKQNDGDEGASMKCGKLKFPGFAESKAPGVENLLKRKKNTL